MTRLALILLAACGSKPTSNPGGDGGGNGDANPTDGSAADDAATVTDAVGDAATTADAAVVDARPPVDAFPSVLDLRINCQNDCVLVADPAAINVAAGTSFEVNWINTGDT